MNVGMLPMPDELSRYLQEIKEFPVLAVEQERDLVARWHGRQDQQALRLLVGSHLRLVVKIARGYRGYGLALGDLIAEGNVGLMQAVEKFDPGRGFRLSTYAMWWIRATIQEFILHNWSLVKMGTTAAQKKLFFNLRAIKSRMQELETGDLSPRTVSAIADELVVPEKDVIEMNRRLAGDQSLNVTLNDESGTEWQEMLADERPNPESRVVDLSETHYRQKLLAEGLGRLNDRERHILTERRLKDNPLTLEELSRQYAVSRERVRQIEERAFAKLQKAVRSAANAYEQATAA